MALQRCFWKFARMAARFRGVAARLLRRSQCFKPAPWRRRGIWHDEEAREHRKEGEQWCADSGRCAVRRLFYRIIQRRILFWLVVVLRWFERFVRSYRTHRASREEIGRAHSELQSLMRISYAVFCLK